MLKQSSSRPGGRGYKVKHVAQMCLIMAVTIWMLYQVRHCYFKKAAAIDERGGGAKGVVKLGRKGLLPGVMEEEEEDDDDEVKGEANEEEGRVDEFEQADDLMEEESEDQETEDNQIEDGSFTNTKRNETYKYVKLQRG